MRFHHLHHSCPGLQCCVSAWPCLEERLHLCMGQRWSRARSCGFIAMALLSLSQTAGLTAALRGKESWDSLITEVYTVYLQVHNMPFAHCYFFCLDRFLVHVCYSSCPGLLLRLLQLHSFFCRHQWFGAGGGHLAACCCLFDIFIRPLAESREL